MSGTGANGLAFVGVGRLGGATGTINISGAGSQLVVAGVGGQNTQGLDGVGGLVVIGGISGSPAGSSGTLNVTGGGSLLISDNGLVTTNGGPGLRLGDGAAARQRRPSRRRLVDRRLVDERLDGDHAFRASRQRRQRADDDQQRRNRVAARHRASATSPSAMPRPARASCR